MRCAVFLDKDGTLVRDVPYNVDPAAIELALGAGEALRRLASLGFAIVVVSNQSGVARGYFDEAALIPVEQRLRDLLAREGVRLDAFYYCPHHPQGVVDAYRRICGCRKPAEGMLRRAAADLDLDLAASWLIGDILDDVEAGNRAGCRTVLVANGGETEWRRGPGREPWATAGTLAEAARAIAAASLPAPRSRVAATRITSRRKAVTR